MEYIWEAQQQLGARVNVIESTDGVTVPLEKILDAIDDTTCLVALAHTSYRSSYRVDAAAIHTKSPRERRDGFARRLPVSRRC
jgi:selenocysteine lyase/cysteine desulfurase